MIVRCIDYSINKINEKERKKNMGGSEIRNFCNPEEKKSINSWQIDCKKIKKHEKFKK